jgi:hypothetical protein
MATLSLEELLNHWMAKPSVAPPFVMLSVHPVGFVTESGDVAIKSWPGTQANQNVPMLLVLELEFFKVIV